MVKETNEFIRKIIKMKHDLNESTIYCSFMVNEKDEIIFLELKSRKAVYEEHDHDDSTPITNIKETKNIKFKNINKGFYYCS